MEASGGGGLGRQSPGAGYLVRCRLSGGRIASVRAGAEPVRRLFNEGQERFLSDCAGMPINLDALTLLPPVTAIRWENVRVQRLEGVVAERWTIDDLDSSSSRSGATLPRKQRLHKRHLSREFKPSTSNATTSTNRRPSLYWRIWSAWSREGLALASRSRLIVQVPQILSDLTRAVCG
jgi:hypothetical protein